MFDTMLFKETAWCIILDLYFYSGALLKQSGLIFKFQSSSLPSDVTA